MAKGSKSDSGKVRKGQDRARRRRPSASQRRARPLSELLRAGPGLRPGGRRKPMPHLASGAARRDGENGAGRRQGAPVGPAGAADRGAPRAARRARCCSSSRAWTRPARAASSGTSSAPATRRACGSRRSRPRPPEERSHDFLWRIRNALPPAGKIGVFDRSHYEDVLVVRVHELVPRATWARRYATINRFEQRLVDDGTTVVKVMLHISADEQKRATARPAAAGRTSGGSSTPATSTSASSGRPTRRPTRSRITKCSTDAAPWYVVPADHKWYARWAVQQLLIEALERHRPAVAAGRLRRQGREGPARPRPDGQARRSRATGRSVSRSAIRTGRRRTGGR